MDSDSTQLTAAEGVAITRGKYEVATARLLPTIWQVQLVKAYF